MSTLPRAIAHIAISIPDLDAAIAWYEDILGFRLMGPPADIKVRDGGRIAELCVDMLDDSLGEVRIANLSAAGGTALELFEFTDPAHHRPDRFEYWRTGPFHLAVIDPDVDGLVERMVATGGKRRSKTWTLIEGLPYLSAYAEDPWGTVIEVFSHSHEATFSNVG